MWGETSATRRTVVKFAGGAIAATPLAGCLADEEPEAELDPDEEAPEDEPEEPDRASEWEDVDEIRLESDVTVWVGAEPDPIDGEENPTLVLFEGREYAISWENVDGFPHNIELRDADDEIVDDHATRPIEGEGETQTLEFEAIDELAEYVCDPHEPTMRGEIEVVDG